MDLVRRPHAKNLVRFGEEHPKALVLSADLTSSCEADEFRDTYPDRFFSVGLAEQHMMSFAAGLAREGYFPFIHTFAVFICRRPFDQVAMSIAYPNLPVRMIGFLPGITTPGGATHQATDDIALMRLLPNMTVLECGDVTEVESVLDVAQSVNGPVYVRILRGEVPRLFDSAEPMRLGQARVLSRGTDVTVLSAGISTEEVMKATAPLAKRGVQIRHLHTSTHKPFDDPAVQEALDVAQHGVITIENHTIIGGLGSAVAEMMAEQGLPKRLIRLGLQDQFAHGASRAYLLQKYGLDSAAFVGAVETLIGQKLKVENDEFKLQNLYQTTASALGTEAKPEDL